MVFSFVLREQCVCVCVSIYNDKQEKVHFQSKIWIREDSRENNYYCQILGGLSNIWFRLVLWESRKENLSKWGLNVTWQGEGTKECMGGVCVCLPACVSDKQINYFKANTEALRDRTCSECVCHGRAPTAISQKKWSLFEIHLPLWLSQLRLSPRYDKINSHLEGEKPRDFLALSCSLKKDPCLRRSNGPSF